MDTRSIWLTTSRLVDLTASDAPLAVTLAEVVSAARIITNHECRAALFIHDPDEACLNLGVNGGLPEAYVHAIQGFKVAEHQPSCGRAAFIGEEVIAPDIKLDARWQPFVGLADAHSIKACWSFPILSDTTVLGTLAIYHDEPSEPKGGDAEAMRYLATIASAAIGRSRLRALYEEDLRQLPVNADVPPGERSGAGLESIRRYVIDQEGGAAGEDR
jgi:GAF domain-containing protein